MKKFQNAAEEKYYYKKQWEKIFDQFYNYSKEEFLKHIKMLQIAIAIADIEDTEDLKEEE